MFTDEVIIKNLKGILVLFLIKNEDEKKENYALATNHKIFNETKTISIVKKIIKNPHLTRLTSLQKKIVKDILQWHMDNYPIAEHKNKLEISSMLNLKLELEYWDENHEKYVINNYSANANEKITSLTS